MKTTKTQRLTVLLEPNSVRRVKILALDNGVSASEVVRRAVTDYVARTKNKGAEQGTRFVGSHTPAAQL
jgi:hypothetical protein